MTPPPPIAQLELLLRQLLLEQRNLLSSLDAHAAALRSCSVEKIERAAREQDAVRLRIAAIETRRRQVTHHLSRQHRTTQPITLTLLAEWYPDRRPTLDGLKRDLADVVGRSQRQVGLIARITQGVLGHVNATLRLVASASGPATYTASGDTAMPLRLGRLNAVA